MKYGTNLLIFPIGRETKAFRRICSVKKVSSLARPTKILRESSGGKEPLEVFFLTKGMQYIPHFKPLHV